MNNYIYEFRTRRVRRSVACDVQSKIYGPECVASVVRTMTKGDARETFFVFMLDIQNKVIGYEVVAIGSLADVNVHPREVFRPAIVAPAAAIVVAHNHPSEDCVPSEEDHELTRRIGIAGKLLMIPLVDHVVVGEHGHTSLHELCSSIREGEE